jgi:hypothetical protein
MGDVVHETLEEVGSAVVRNVEDVFEADRAAREVAREAVRRLVEARTGAAS